MRFAPSGARVEPRAAVFSASIGSQSTEEFLRKLQKLEEGVLSPGSGSKPGNLEKRTPNVQAWSRNFGAPSAIPRLLLGNILHYCFTGLLKFNCLLPFQRLPRLKVAVEAAFGTRMFPGVVGRLLNILGGQPTGIHF